MVNVYNTYASTFTGKKTEKQAKNDAFHALLVIKGGGKPLITTNKLAGPVGGLAPNTPLPTEGAGNRLGTERVKKV